MTAQKSLLPLTSALALAAVALPGRAGSAEIPRTNVLLILVDDLGIEQLALYDDVNGYPTSDPYEYAHTPNIDALAAGGVRFTQARANPICSPTRAAIQSGRYAFHTGAGAIVRPQDASPSFHEFSMAPASNELLLPELPELARHAAGFFGKWHLGLEIEDGGSGDAHPLWVGWPHFSGAMHNLDQAPNPGGLVLAGHEVDAGYNHWYRVEDGQRKVETEYATVRQRRDCQDWILEHAQEPWLAVLSFSACHAPYDYPPDGLHSFPPLWPEGTGVLWDHYRAMLETIDHELGVLFAGLGSEMDETLVLFMADNGSPRQVLESARAQGQGLGAYGELVDQDRFKSSVYESGVRVPLIARGPQVVEPGRSSAALVDAVDLYATLREVARGASAAQRVPESDGRSFLEVLAAESEAGARTTSLSERFEPNGLPVDAEAAFRGFVLLEGAHRYKLVQRPGVPDELYDLSVDPFETQDLGTQHEAYRRVAFELRKLLATP